MRSRHGALSFSIGDQTPFVGEATLVDLERVSIDAHQLHRASS